MSSKSARHIISGERYGRLVTVSRGENRKGCSYWLCRCDCGKNSLVRGVSLAGGSTRSCGCLKGTSNRTHGLTHTPEYRSWAYMKERCYNPNNKRFPNYGMRGITVCDRWRESFENFLADMGLRPSPKHSIDRIDNNGNYEPGNCRWATAQQQSLNRRDRKLYELHGEKHYLSEWAPILGIRFSTLRGRVSDGWPFERAATEPVFKADNRIDSALKGKA